MGFNWDEKVAEDLLAAGEEMGARSGKMFGLPAVFLGHRLAACAYDDGVGIKLPEARVNELITQGRATHFQPNGKSPMREWAHISVHNTDDVVRLRDLLDESAAHLSGPAIRPPGPG